MSHASSSAATLDAPRGLSAEAPDRPAGPRVHARIFAALVHPFEALPAPVLQALHEAGYDAADPSEVPLPAEVFHRAVAVMAQHLAGGDPLDEGERRAGRALMRGFAMNPAGRVYTDSLARLGPERVLTRLPEGLHHGAVGMHLEVETLGLRCWRLRLTGERGASPELFCGCLQGILDQAGVATARAEVESIRGRVTTVLVSWDAGEERPLPERRG